MEPHVYPTLYGRSTHGSVKVWNCRVEGTKAEARVIISHGQEGGKQQETTRRITEGKNLEIGRAHV